MKKVLWLVLVLLVIGVGFLGTGCTTVSRYDSYHEGDVKGDVPMVGEEIFVHHMMGRETLGPYEKFVVYSNNDGDDHSLRVFSTFGFSFSGLDEVGKTYIVAKKNDAEVGGNIQSQIRFLKITE